MLVGEVWSTFLGEELRPYEIERPAELPPSLLSCQVRISGSWNGIVTLTMTEAGATSVARAMFDRRHGELGRRDLDDAVGELGNIVAGNIKSCLPEPSVLSLPSVAATVQPSTGEVRVDVTLAWDAHLALVTLTETETEPAQKVGA